MDCRTLDWRKEVNKEAKFSLIGSFYLEYTYPITLFTLLPRETRNGTQKSR